MNPLRKKRFLRIRKRCIKHRYKALLIISVMVPGLIPLDKISVRSKPARSAPAGANQNKPER